MFSRILLHEIFARVLILKSLQQIWDILQGEGSWGVQFARKFWFDMISSFQGRVRILSGEIV